MSVFSNRMSEAKNSAAEYTRAVLGLLGDQNPMAVLASTADHVDIAIEGVPEDRVRAPESPGKWSALAVVRHLVDSDLVWAIRLRKAVAEDRPQIHGYDQDLWAERLHYERENPADVAREFRMLRNLNLRFLKGLSREEWGRVGVHSERGEESVDHMVRLYAGHDLLHLKQIRRILGGLEVR